MLTGRFDVDGAAARQLADSVCSSLMSEAHTEHLTSLLRAAAGLPTFVSRVLAGSPFLVISVTGTKRRTSSRTVVDQASIG